MAKSFIDVVQDSPRTGLGIPVKTTKPPLSKRYTAFRFLNFAGSWFQLKVVYDSSVIRLTGTHAR